MKPAVMMALNQNLKMLHLSNTANRIDGAIRHAKEIGISYEEFLLELTEIEIQVRMDLRQKRRLKEAKFPLMKFLETFEFESAPELDIRLIKDIAEGSFIKEHKNVILLGKSGVGKTHLATAIGIEACKHNFNVRFVSGYALVNELIEQRKEKELSRMIQKYSRYDLLILDELGYVPFSKEGAELLFQILAQRHEKGSVVITSNLGFGDWTQIFGDPTMTAALLDRLTYKAHIISCNWKSYRLKQTLKEKQKLE